MGQQQSIPFRGGGARFAEQTTGTLFAERASVKEAGAAIAKARARRARAEVVEQLVLVQAIAALQRAGLSVREVADALILSKSEAGRRIKSAPHGALDYPDDILRTIASDVAEVWGMPMTEIRDPEDVHAAPSASPRVRPESKPVSEV